MTKKFKFFGTLMMALLAISLFTISCSKDDDPADNDFFVGTYNGTIGFSSGSETITDEDGKMTVVKVGNSYSFKIGSGIPDINNVKFKDNGDNTYVSIGDGVTGITIDASTLKMLVSNDEGTWTANCTR